MGKKTTFEKAMKDLEGIVLELEGGDPPLEKALEKFEEGMKLARFCSEKLEETERKVSLLMKRADGGAEETPLDPGDAAEEEP
jgi:exodeoxyribonuclease VII small subunit